jgi:hypothetical protein
MAVVVRPALREPEWIHVSSQVRENERTLALASLGRSVLTESRCALVASKSTVVLPVILTSGRPK